MKSHLVGRMILVVLLGPVLCGVVNRAHAGEITLSVTTTSRVAGGEADVSFSLHNQGSDAADQVALEAVFMGRTQAAKVADRLEPNGKASAAFKWPEIGPAQGAFPLYVRIQYLDPSGMKQDIATVARVRVNECPDATVKMTAIPNADGVWGRVRLRLDELDGPAVARITCHAPRALSPTPTSRTVVLDNGTASTEFQLDNGSPLTDNRYSVSLIAEYDLDGVHYTSDVSTDILIPADSQRGRGWRISWPAVFFLTAAFVGLMMLRRAFLCGIKSDTGEPVRSNARTRVALEILALLSVEAFLAYYLGSRHLFTETITTGGDTASHYYTLHYLRHVLLPSGRISSWTPANYAGFPILQFYFPLPFLIMCALDAVMPLQVAFKLVTLLGIFLLPVGAYTMLRMIRCPFPGPSLGAAFVLPFLFNTANSMWGGNILSTLAGEFSYSLSMALSLVLLGCLYRGCLERRWVVLNGVLVFLVGFSHGYTLLFVEAMSLFLVITPRGFVQRVVYLGKVYVLGFCLLAFWLVPLLAFGRMTTPYHTVWTIRSVQEVFPPVLWPMVIAAGIGVLGWGIIGMTARKETHLPIWHSLGYLLFGLAVSGVMFVLAPKLGVVDIRYVPFAQLLLCLITAFALGWFGYSLRRAGFAWPILALGVTAVLAWTSAHVGPTSDWGRWNYSGFEAKPAWPMFKQINKSLDGSFQDPRVVFEHSSSHNAFGTTRAFESLPLFAGRATLEGLYMQASISAPSVFYIQSLVSENASCPFPQYTYATMDFSRAQPRLEIFNVREVILRSEAAKLAIRKADGYTLSHTIGAYEIWRIAGPNRYVTPVLNTPELYPGDDWKAVAHQWFSNDDMLDTPLVFMSRPGPKELARFGAPIGASEQRKPRPIDVTNCRIEEDIRDREIRIRTNWIGKPLLVKTSYHPNWRVEGADCIYLASPSFMLIYPTQENVRLYYCGGFPNRVGFGLTIIGFMVIASNIPFLVKRRTLYACLEGRFRNWPQVESIIRWNPSDRVRHRMLLVVCLSSALGLGMICRYIYTHEPHRLFNASIRMKDNNQYEKARRGFRSVIASSPATNIATDSAYYIAVTYYMEGDLDEAIAAFEELLRLYPRSKWSPEAHYHVGMCLLRSGRSADGVERLKLVGHRYPGTDWAEYAEQRLSDLSPE